MKIATKLPATIIGIAVTAIAVTSIIAYWDASESMEHAVFEKLHAIEAGRAHELENYLTYIQNELILLSDNDVIVDAVDALDRGWYAQQGDTEALHRAYVTDSPHTEDERHLLEDAGDGSLYSEAHAQFHPWFHELQMRRGYRDIFLIDLKGNVVYSAAKHLEFATNIASGKWRDTGLAKAFAGAKDAEHGEITFADFTNYAPAGGHAAAFMATPITDHDGVRHGVMAFRMPIDRINNLLQQSDGMGRTGDTFIAGPDLLMRSDSRLTDEETLLTRTVDTAQVKAALAGERGVMVSTNHAGERVAAAYSGFEFLGVPWAIVVEKGLNEVEEPVDAMTTILAVAGVIIAVLAAVAGFFIAVRMLTRPLTGMTVTMGRLAEKDWTTEVPYTTRTDEIGDMARAVEVFKTNGIEVERLEAEQKRLEAQAEEDKRRMMNQLADDFTQQVGSIVDAVASTATQLEATAQSVSAIAEETTAQSSTVAAAAEESSVNVQTVSSASEEMSASIREMTSQVGQSRDAATTASDNVTSTGQQVSELSNAADAIGQVIDLIRDIAEQTNLLALNATIEAARAGEAGKGFSVVAGEVKALATQTQKATEEIRQQIEGIQSQSQTAVGAITGMRDVIAKVAEITEAIAQGIEQQSMATGEIARNAQEAAAGTREVSQSVTMLTDAAQQSSAAATELLQASGELARQGEHLRSKVDSFIQQVRAA